MALNKKNLFIAHTEYHLMMSVHIAITNYSVGYENIIYITKSPNRFNMALNCNVSEYIKFRLFDNIDENEFCNVAISDNYNRFFFFQEMSIFNKYIAHKLKQNGTIICLAPDGTKPYGLFYKKNELLSLIKNTIEDYFIFRKSGLRMKSIFPSRYYRYGSFRILDEVWLTNPELFNKKRNKTKGEIIKIKPFGMPSLKLFENLFCFQDELKNTRNGIIIYFNQPFNNSQMIEKEFEFLTKVVCNFNDSPFFIKLHPLTSSDSLLRYTSLNGVKLIESKFPAELYINSLTNSIIFSGWSAALASHNKACNYYYNYPIYESVKDMLFSQIIITPLPHIHVVEAPEDMKFQKKVQ